MKKIAFYGKGGIGKSTTAANVSAAFSRGGKKVCQIGCDPKNDSTRLLLGRIAPLTVLDAERSKKGAALSLAEIAHEGYGGVRCIEAGGPEPGVGCAGRGIIVALERLKALHAFDDVDVAIYDVLGDVVCGGFAVPIREGYAEEIYIVSSGELMSLYAANDVAREKELLEAFAARLGTKLIAYIPRSAAVHEAEIHRQTLIAYAPDSAQAKVYEELAAAIEGNKNLVIPQPMAFEELEDLVESYGN